MGAVADEYRMCAVTDTDIEVEWRPRAEEIQRHADALSKYEDASQYQAIYDKLLAQPEFEGRRPDVDVFADEYTKVPGAFYARYWNPTVPGIDGLAHSWAPGERREVPLLYAYPPFQIFGQGVAEGNGRQAGLSFDPAGVAAGWRALLLNLPKRA